MRYHLKASTPNLSITSHGSTVLPLDFDIFCPSLSKTKSLTSTCLKQDSPDTKVEIAMSE